MPWNASTVTRGPPCVLRIVGFQDKGGSSGLCTRTLRAVSYNGQLLGWRKSSDGVFQGINRWGCRTGSFCCGWLAKRLDSEFDSAGYLVEIYLGLALFKRVKMEFCRRADCDCIHECSKR